MGCCVCRGGFCNHVGACSYCQQHAYNPWQQFPMMPAFQPQACEHCYCWAADDSEGPFVWPKVERYGPHRKCCKCGNVMAEEFLNVNKIEATP